MSTITTINEATNGKEYKIPVAPDAIKIIRDPNLKGKLIIHAYPLIRNFPNGMIPDNVNPRSHDRISPRIASAIETSLEQAPSEFHLRNRGITVLADKADYDTDKGILTLTVPDKSSFGLVDGATTDRTLARIKKSVPEFDKLRTEELPDFLQSASVHVEIITGDFGEGLVPFAAARNTSVQVKEFALENLGGGFDWLKTTLTNTEFAGKVRYRENDPEPVSVLDVLALLTLFHPRWSQEHTEPTEAYSAKGRVLEMFRETKYLAGYQQLSGITADILRLYDHVQATFPEKYQEAKASRGLGAKLGARREIKFNEGKLFKLPLTGAETHYLIPDGWLYPILASMRMLVDYKQTPAVWLQEPKAFYDKIGRNLVADVADQSEAMSFRPSEVGKNRVLYNSLRKGVEMARLNFESKGESSGGQEETPVPTEPAGKLRVAAHKKTPTPRKNK